MFTLVFCHQNIITVFAIVQTIKQERNVLLQLSVPCPHSSAISTSPFLSDSFIDADFMLRKGNLVYILIRLETTPLFDDNYLLTGRTTRAKGSTHGQGKKEYV